MWIVSMVVAAACFGALAVAWIEDRDTPADHHAPRAAVSISGFTTGLVLGIGIGALAATALLRRR